MATPIDDNAADEKSDKSIQQLLNIRCTSTVCLKTAFRKYTAKLPCIRKELPVADPVGGVFRLRG